MHYSLLLIGCFILQASSYLGGADAAAYKRSAEDSSQGDGPDDGGHGGHHGGPHFNLTECDNEADKANFAALKARGPPTTTPGQTRPPHGQGPPPPPPGFSAACSAAMAAAFNKSGGPGGHHGGGPGGHHAGPPGGGAPPSGQASQVAKRSPADGQPQEGAHPPLPAECAADKEKLEELHKSFKGAHGASASGSSPAGAPPAGAPPAGQGPPSAEQMKAKLLAAGVSEGCVAALAKLVASHQGQAPPAEQASPVAKRSPADGQGAHPPLPAECAADKEKLEELHKSFKGGPQGASPSGSPPAAGQAPPAGPSAEQKEQMKAKVLAAGVSEGCVAALEKLYASHQGQAPPSGQASQVAKRSPADGQPQEGAHPPHPAECAADKEKLDELHKSFKGGAHGASASGSPPAAGQAPPAGQSPPSAEQVKAKLLAAGVSEGCVDALAKLFASHQGQAPPSGQASQVAKRSPADGQPQEPALPECSAAEKESLKKLHQGGSHGTGAAPPAGAPPAGAPPAGQGPPSEEQVKAKLAAAGVTVSDSCLAAVLKFAASLKSQTSQ